ncbi:porin [Microvirga pakistanensis]|uniref:porin n=1 Tax=Microvirga pakistanensis TaxID=1682650 RepID=UPI00106A3992|nr:porin [Microvirga pakistanensis]
MKHVTLILPALLLALGAPAQAASPCPPGFAMLQASDTCVRVGGRVRAETILRSSGNRKADTVTSQASGRVQMDVRKQTEYGPLRAFIRVEGIRP